LIKDLCQALGVSRSGYYGWLNHQEYCDQYTDKVINIFTQNYKRYGVRRITAELQDSNMAIGHKRVRRIMHQNGLVAIAPKSFVPRTTDSRHHMRMSPNLLLERAIKADRPHQIIVGDITYLPLMMGKWAYLATWMDLFTRKIVGWQVNGSMTAELVISALNKAISQQILPAGLIVHSDRGGQYADSDFRRILSAHKFEQSMSRARETYDNAFAESLFSRLKAEISSVKGQFVDLKHAENSCYSFIDYYNQRRRHSALGYNSPDQFEWEYYQSQRRKGTKTSG